MVEYHPHHHSDFQYSHPLTVSLEVKYKYLIYKNVEGYYIITVFLFIEKSHLVAC